MKIILAICLLTIAFSGAINVSTKPLPSCVTGTPFKISIDDKASNIYNIRTVASPAFVSIDTKGVISGSTAKAGAFPVTVQVSDKSGNSEERQYILKVLDNSTTDDKIWAYGSKDYYNRAVSNPLKVNVDSSATLKVT